MAGIEISVIPPTTASSEVQNLLATATHSAIFSGIPPTADIPRSAVIVGDVAFYMRMTSDAATDPEDDGTDMLFLANQQYRVHPIPDGFYLHFKKHASSAAGTVYITPDA